MGTLNFGWLSLTLIYSHSKCQSNRKLSSSTLQRQILCSWCKSDSGNKDNISCKLCITTDDPTLQELSSNLRHPQPCTITKPLWWIQIPQQHVRTSNLESKVCKWKGTWNQRIEIFWSIGLMFIHNRIIKLNSVSTQQHLFVTRKQFQHLWIQLPDNIIFASKNASIQKVLIIWIPG